jgi:GNAT superfamily N-acetyltransferase
MVHLLFVKTKVACYVSGMTIQTKGRTAGQPTGMEEVGGVTAQLLTGTAIAAGLNDMATLRLEIFREYPYLYEGHRDDELDYLGTYVKAPDACVILAHEGATVIGAVTGMPLTHEDQQMRAAFAGTTFPLDEIYYIGEMLFRPAYRNCGLGRKLLGQMERQIRSLGHYRTLACATVERPDDHPLRPADYLPITRFLAHTGFVRLPGVSTHFTWRETDGIKRDHPMQFWIKALT